MAAGTPIPRRREVTVSARRRDFPEGDITDLRTATRDMQVLSWASTCDRQSFEHLAIQGEMPVVRAYQILNRLLDDVHAHQRDPHTIAFWRSIRDGFRQMSAAA
jgi:hypothetical protein